MDLIEMNIEPSKGTGSRLLTIQVQGPKMDGMTPINKALDNLYKLRVIEQIQYANYTSGVLEQEVELLEEM